MNLLDVMKEPCVMLDRRTVPDGIGSFGYEWTEGARFQAVIRKDSSPELRVAEQEGTKEHYTIIVDKSIVLQYNDVFRRESDGQTFRLTSSTIDNMAPSRSTVPIAKATAERWVLQ